MTNTQPYMNVKLFGDGRLTKLDTSIRWDHGESLERFIKLSSADGPKTVDYSDIDNISLIVVYSEKPTIIHITESGNTVALQTSGFFSLSATETLMANLTQLQIEATSTETQEVQVRIYGTTVS